MRSPEWGPKPTARPNTPTRSVTQSIGFGRDLVDLLREKPNGTIWEEWAKTSNG